MSKMFENINKHMQVWKFQNYKYKYHDNKRELFQTRLLIKHS